MPNGVYNGSQCSQSKRKAIVDGVKAGVPINKLARDVHASEHTVSIVRDQELPDWRKVQSRNLERFSSNVIQSLLAMTPEQLQATGLSERCVALGIAMDKKALLDGEPSQIVEHRHSVDVQTLRSSLSLHDEIDVTPSNHGYTLDTGHDKPLIPEQTQNSQ